LSWDNLREWAINHTPDLEDYLKPLAEQMQVDPTALSGPTPVLDEVEKLSKNKVYTWKALRLIAKSKLHYFSKIPSTGGLEDVVAMLESEKKTPQPSLPLSPTHTQISTQPNKLQMK